MPDTRIPSFVRHRTRLTEGQQHAWDQWWSEYGGEVAETDRLDVTPPTVLEIGSGNGEATALMAAAAPSVHHVAVEVYEPGLAHLLIRLRAAELANLRLLRGDAVDLLERAVPESSLEGIRIFFPDPWPKRRHHKRRLVQPDFVALAASRLRPGGWLHLATDWAHYADQMLAVCEACPALTRAPESDPWYPRPDSRPLTKFEQRAVREGRIVRDLLYTA
ncbi:tRNA (guanosine(46)-N7)-methyltransferase TrmB [Pseudonocardia pini]|uniref:tRNA (guanosine(46)-N7)-methyltransferase TrmB n=1 Tax=Pseudonocardia pini TaxID=2758030 RepID=UPI0015F025F5|nr:tRNA (guanosine(46)-N7)-methyltransferase TrmB [Pseudonocardia pini]